MGDRDSNNWVPIVAGVVVGAGILTLLYKMFFSNSRTEPVKIMRTNQQINAPYKCTCDSGGIDPVAEEQERKRRERERLRRNRLAQEAEAEAEAASREPPPPRFSVLQLAVGTTTCMLALAALILTKVLDQDTAHAILSKVGLGHLIPKRVEVGGVDGAFKPCPVKLNPSKRRWPLETEKEEGKQ